MTTRPPRRRRASRWSRRRPRRAPASPGSKIRASPGSKIRASRASRIPASRGKTQTKANRRTGTGTRAAAKPRGIRGRIRASRASGAPGAQGKRRAAGKIHLRPGGRASAPSDARARTGPKPRGSETFATGRFRPQASPSRAAASRMSSHSSSAKPSGTLTFASRVPRGTIAAPKPSLRASARRC